MRFLVDCPRRLRCWLVALGSIVLAPPLIWVVVLAVVPTGWACERISQKLSAASGRRVHIERARVGLFGDISLQGLTIGAPNEINDPWLKVAESSIDVSLRQIFCGHVEPAEVVLDGVELRVLRRADGTIELGDFLARKPVPGTESDSIENDCPGVNLRIKNGRLTLLDLPSNTRVEVMNVEAQAITRGHVVSINDLVGTLNGGRVALAAQFDRSGPEPKFEGQLRLVDVDLSEGMDSLAYLVPIVAEGETRLEGKLGLNLYVKGRGERRETFRSSLQGRGQVSLDPIKVENSRFLAVLGRIAELPADGGVGAIHTDLTIKEGVISSENLTLDLARLPIVFTGSTDFEGRLNYRLRSDDLVERIPNRARGFLEEIGVDIEKATDVQVTGKVGAPTLLLDGVPLNQPSASGRDKNDELGRFREIGRRLRDRIRR